MRKILFSLSLPLLVNQSPDAPSEYLDISKDPSSLQCQILSKSSEKDLIPFSWKYVKSQPNTFPPYPIEAKRRGIRGEVVLEIQINVDGSIKEVTALAGPKALYNAAISYTKQWRFNRAAVSATIPVPKIVFSISYGFIGDHPMVSINKLTNPTPKRDQSNELPVVSSSP
jgi:TonB family protein